MGAVWYRARADLRGAAAGTLLIALLVGLTGSIVLTAVAGARRGRDAIPEFLAYTRAGNAAVFLDPTLPPAEQNRLARALVALPEWAAAGAASQPVLTVPAQADLAEATGFVGQALLVGTFLHDVNRPLLIDGRLADPRQVGELVVNQEFATGVGVRVGDSLTARTVTPDHLDAVVNAGFEPDPTGEDVRLTVVGITREPDDLSYEALAQPGTLYAVRRYHVYLTAAFWDRYGEHNASYNTGVFGRLAPGVTANDLEMAAVAVGGDRVQVERQDPRLILVASAQTGIDFEANALLLFALVVGVAGIVLVGQLLSRQVSPGQLDTYELAALGLRRSQRAAVPLVRGVIVAGLGALLAVGGGVALSRFTPIGLARKADVHPGIRVDPTVLAVGGVVILAAVIAWCAVIGWRAARLAPTDRAARMRDRPSRVVSRLAKLGTPVSVVAGVRMALERGRGRTAVPVGSALGATTVGVLTVTAALVFAASLHHVVVDPMARGWNWDVAVGAYFDADAARAGREPLDNDPDVAAYLGFSSSTPMRIDDVDTYGGALGPGDDTVGPPMLEGRLPAAPDEIIVGPGTLDDLGKAVGDHVQVTLGGTVDARIVGVMVPIATLDGQMTMTRGALMTHEGAAALDPQEGVVPSQYLVRFAPGADRASILARLRDEYPGTVVTATVPSDIENLRRVQRLPALVAAFVALLAVVTLVNTLVTGVRRRRRDLALFATLGFRRRQLAGTVAWQATTLALIALVVGIPLGVAAGRVAWHLVVYPFASSLEPTVPVLALVVLAGAWLVIANLAAALPARSAARTHPAEAFRAE